MVESKFAYLRFEKKKLKSLVSFFRENGILNPQEFEILWKEFISYLRSSPEVVEALYEEIGHVLNLTGLKESLCESNINNHTSFLQEFGARFRHRILPKLRSENPFRFRLKRIFDFEKDKIWLSHFTVDHLREFLELSNTKFLTDERAESIILESIRNVSIRISALGVDEKLNIRDISPEEHQLEFFHVTVITSRFIEAVKHDDQHAEAIKDELRSAIDRCVRYLKDVNDSFQTQGASVDKAFSVFKCNDLLHRLEHLLNVIQPGNQNRDAAIYALMTDLFKEEFGQEGILDFFKENLKDLSLRISDHASNTGEHYIASGFKEYYNFLFAAIGAGFVVSVLVYFKAWLHQIGAPPMWEAVLFSINYAFGFLLIQLFHFTLATKQPAMTAAAISRSLGKEKSETTIAELGITIARVFHTQTISFVGNLLIVFPLPFLLAWLMHWGFDYKLFEDPQQAIQAMDNQHPWRSGALWYAAITGFYLFISGIVAGYVDNRVIYSKIPNRVRQLKWLHSVIGFKRTVKFSKYLETNAGGLAGNITLGILLGTATFIGNITGLPFDIRHITFAAGSFTSALYYAWDLAVLADIIVITLGILLIGFVNFSVSFGLAFYLACKSRDISIKDTPELFQFLLKYAKKYPADFIRAPLKPRLPKDILD